MTTTIATTSEDTSSPSYIPRGTATAKLTFYAPPPDNSAPYNYVDPQPGIAQRNYLEPEQTVQITDIRNKEDNFNLDKDAFQVLQRVPTKTTYTTFESDASVRKIYYPEVESLLLSALPGAQKVILFDHTIRRQKDGAPRQPVNRAHVDQTRRAAIARVRKHVSDPAEAEELLKGRYRIVNVWRPLKGPVQSMPLAFASATSVDDKDLVPIEHRYPDRNGETMGVQFNEGQKWHYWSGMMEDERILLKCSDSEASGTSGNGLAQWVPHTAFWDPRTPAGAKGRESIEVRALVFG
ncbi:uncharacterized protein N7515_004513 [Penicillium bovifimosum]|uniref:Methyltransferase n=1 Tax=Penicillium bovifimosum TaxID=126998 RepID=A0A9W9H0E2_9EURO|nr:uncharacterized protein N7515_004513 [Penicillium bovifimosum]KAJ5135235.1 hypothetical protein N7515_004513 [Penicillium bovifimosum]